MVRLRILDDLLAQNLAGMPVFLRADFNLPRSGGEVLDDARMRATLPTLRALSAAGARTLIFSHYGRPRGEHRADLSLRPLAPLLSRFLAADVSFAPDCLGSVAVSAAAETPHGGFCLFENLRFHEGETSNEAAFADALSSLAEAYVNDAFGCSHRAHASIVGVAQRIERRAAGRLLVSETTALHRLLDRPERPFVAVVGGAKIRGKIDTLENLLPRLDTLLVGGAMANTLLAAQGHRLGSSLVAKDELEVARRLLAEAEARQIEVVLPSDLVVTDRLGGDGERTIETVAVEDLADGWMAVDVGKASLLAFDRALASAGTVFWNGPIGLFETPPFDEGSHHLARSLAASSAYTVIGGGETVAVVSQSGVANDIDHISTGGGAALELLAGKTLPGVEVLLGGDP